MIERKKLNFTFRVIRVQPTRVSPLLYNFGWTLPRLYEKQFGFAVNIARFINIELYLSNWVFNCTWTLIWQGDDYPK